MWHRSTFQLQAETSAAIPFLAYQRVWSASSSSASCVAAHLRILKSKHLSADITGCPIGYVVAGSFLSLLFLVCAIIPCFVMCCCARRPSQFVVCSPSSAYMMTRACTRAPGPDTEERCICVRCTLGLQPLYSKTCPRTFHCALM